MSRGRRMGPGSSFSGTRSEEHTSELQSRQYLVCRILLEKKKMKTFQSAIFSHGPVTTIRDPSTTIVRILTVVLLKSVAVLNVNVASFSTTIRRVYIFGRG